MNISIKKDNNEMIKGIVSFDKNGNVYIDISKHYKSNNILQICVDGQNKPYCDPGDYSILNDAEHVFGNMFNSNEEEKIKVDESDTDDEEPISGVKYDPICNISETYYYEEKGTYYNLKDKHDDDSKFHFCTLSSDDEIPVMDRLNGDILALYDTFLYKDGNNIFRSKLVGEVPLYILKLHETGEVYFRNICNKNIEKEYRFVIDKEDNLQIV